MPLYFFHSYDDVEIIDRIGTELSDDARAHSEAVRLVGAMLKDDPQLLSAGRSFRTEVVSEAGEALFMVTAQAARGSIPSAA